MYDEQNISEEVRDYHRAIQSLVEELEAIDWYNQRIAATRDEELKKLLAHNRDEEKEHAAMLMEYISRRDSDFREQLKKFLFKEGEIED